MVTGRWGAWPFRARSPPLWPAAGRACGSGSGADLSPRGEASACAFTKQNRLGLRRGEDPPHHPPQRLRHPVLFLKIPSPGPLCAYNLCLILRTHIIKLKLNSMKIIPTIAVVANLSLARAKVARQREAITRCSPRPGRMDVQGLRGRGSLGRELHPNGGILADNSSLH